MVLLFGLGVIFRDHEGAVLSDASKQIHGAWDPTISEVMALSDCSRLEFPFVDSWIDRSARYFYALGYGFSILLRWG